jgi:hypothetical protein
MEGALLSATAKQLIREWGRAMPGGRQGWNPEAGEEKREVQIGQAIKSEIRTGYESGLGRAWDEHLQKIEALANELIEMHAAVE